MTSSAYHTIPDKLPALGPPMSATCPHQGDSSALHPLGATVQIRRQYHAPRTSALSRWSTFFSSPRLSFALHTCVYPGSPLPPRWTNMKPAEKHFRCTICQRGFTRIDHLKRHHLRRMLPRPASPPRFAAQSRQIPARSPTLAFSATSRLRDGVSMIAYPRGGLFQADQCSQ